MSCGAFRFAGMDDEKITLVRNPNYHNPFAALVEKRYIYMKDSTDSLFQDFKAGKVDIAYFPPNHVDNLASFMQTSAYKEQAARGEAILEKIHQTGPILTSDGIVFLFSLTIVRYDKP